MQGGKSRQPVPVGGQRSQKGVVHPLHHRVVASAAEPRPIGLIAGAQSTHQLRFGRFKGGRTRLAVQGGKSGFRLHQQPGQPAPLRLPLPMRRELVAPALDGKPLAGARLAHEAGEGFVQRHVIGHPEPSVRRLVDQQFGQLRFRPVNEGAQQRIVEPAERGVGRNPADVGLQALVRETLRGAQRGGVREVAPIGGAAGERMAPLTGLQGEWRRGKDIPQHMAALKVSETPVAGAGVQAHFRLGKLKNLPGSPQPRLERCRGCRIRQQRINRLRRPNNLPVPTHRLGVVAEVSAAA